MALSAATWSTLMQANLASQGVTELTKLKEFCDAIADANVTHITSSAQVVVTSVSGVVTGGGVSGPGTGTVT